MTLLVVRSPIAVVLGHGPVSMNHITKPNGLCPLTDRHCEEERRSNLNACASGIRCKIASSAEKAFSQ